MFESAWHAVVATLGDVYAVVVALHDVILFGGVLLFVALWLDARADRDEAEWQRDQMRAEADRNAAKLAKIETRLMQAAADRRAARTVR